MMKENKAVFAAIIFCFISTIISAPLSAQQKEEPDAAKLREMNKELELKIKDLYIKNEDYNQKKKEIENLTKLVDKLNRERMMYKKESEYLDGEIARLEGNINNERSGLYKELGDTYTESKLFSQAIKAYSMALKLNPKNAEAHYNIALLYQQSEGSTDKAIEHLQLYLKIAPDPKHRKDAEYLLSALRTNRISPYE